MEENIRTLTLACTLLLLTCAAPAAPILTFGFTDLAGSYSSATNVFEILPTADTDGDVTRVLPAVQTAMYDTGFHPGPATLQILMDVFNVQATTAESTGTFMIQDVGGGVISGNLSGNWVSGGLFAAFVGLLSNVVMQPLGDGLFEGPSGGAFSMDFSAYGAGPFEGAVTELMTGNWFQSGDFVSQNVLVHAAIVPEPAVMALLLAGGLILRRR